MTIEEKRSSFSCWELLHENSSKRTSKGPPLQDFAKSQWVSFKGVYCKRKTPLWIYNNQPNQSSHTFQSSISCDKPITGQIHVRCVEQRRRREDKIITRQHDLKNNSFWTFLLFVLLRSTHTKSIRTCFCSIGVKNVKFKTFGFLLENCV